MTLRNEIANKDDLFLIVLSAGVVSLDWSLLDVINDSITNDENVFDDQSDSTQQAGFTLVSLFLGNFCDRILNVLQLHYLNTFDEYFQLFSIYFIQVIYFGGIIFFFYFFLILK